MMSVDEITAFGRTLEVCNPFFELRAHFFSPPSSPRVVFNLKSQSRENSERVFPVFDIHTFLFNLNFCARQIISLKGGKKKLEMKRKRESFDKKKTGMEPKTKVRKLKRSRTLEFTCPNCTLLIAEVVPPKFSCREYFKKYERKCKGCGKKCCYCCITKCETCEKLLCKECFKRQVIYCDFCNWKKQECEKCYNEDGEYFDLWTTAKSYDQTVTACKKCVDKVLLKYKRIIKITDEEI